MSLHQTLIDEGMEIDSIVEDKEKARKITSNLFHLVLEKEIKGYAVWPGKYLFDGKLKDYDPDLFAKSLVIYVKK